MPPFISISRGGQRALLETKTVARFITVVNTLGAHALLLAIICSLPHWVAMDRNHGDYTPFSVSPSTSALTFDETHAYAPPARRFMSTGKISAEVDNYERRTTIANIPFLPPAILGSLGWMLGSLEHSFIVADCIFPALLFLLLYQITGSVIRDHALRLLVAWSSILIPFGFLNSLWLGEDAFIAPLEITRTPQPEISFIILIVAAMFTSRALRQQTWQWIAMAGLASGAVVYSYYFYAVAWGIVLGLLLLLAGVWRSRAVAVPAASILFLMVLLASPFALATFSIGAQSGQAYLLGRMGVYTHRLDPTALFFATLLLLLIAVFGKERWRDRSSYFVLTTLVAASLFGMNFQLVSGYETQAWHFWKRLGLPVSFFLVTSAIAYLSMGHTRLKNAWSTRGAYVVLTLIILNTSARLIYVGCVTAPLHRASDPSLAILTWMRLHVPPGQVIGTVNGEMILLIPAETADYTYVPSGLRSLTPTSEIVDRYDDLACLLNVSTSEVRRVAALRGHLGHSQELLHVLGLSYTGDPAAYQQFVAQYEERAQACSVPRWRLDYLIIDQSRRESIRRRFPGAQQIYCNSRYTLLGLTAH